jgi:hypothetical protein
MRKRKYLVLTLALLSLAILGFTADRYDVGLANALSSASTQDISTFGTINYPTFNPGNLALIPDDWWLTYGNGPQIIHLDYNVTHNGDVSIRLDPHTTNDVNIARECDGTWYSIKPGDHVVAKCWIKTDSNTPAENANPYHGARIGIDYYGPTGSGGITILDSRPNNTDPLSVAVPWNTPTWTLRTWDIIIPSTIFTKDVAGHAIPPTQITQFVIWMQGIQLNDGTAKGSAWFADAELYINP